MSSYPVLYNKPIDQWKVTELKEELKRRKLTTKGLKDDLIRRLDESLQEEIEIANANANADKGLDSDLKPVAQGEDATTVPEIDETNVAIGKSDNKNTELNNVAAQLNVDVDLGSTVQEQVVETDTITSTDSTMLKPDSIIETTVESSVQLTTLDTSVQGTTAEISHEVTTVKFSPVVSGSLVTEVNLSGEELQNNGAPNKSEEFNILQQNENSDPPHEEAKLNSSDLETQVYEANKVTSDSISTDNGSINEKVEDLNIQPQNEDSNPPHEEANPSSIALETQVFEVSKVTSDSISIDNVSINEKIELKDNIIADDVKLEFDVKHGREEPSSSNVDLDDGNLQPMDITEPQENEVKGEENENNADNIDKIKKNDSGDVELSEKLNLDRSSGDDSIEEDASESRQIESKSVSDEAGDRREKMEVTVVRENFPVDAMVDDTSAGEKVENKIGLVVASAKRKPHEQETAGNVETMKRQRRWNSEGLKVLEPHNDNVSPSITPRETFQSIAKRSFSRSDSMASVETPKERVVPPSSKPPTSALRIDRFLRPFTLKAVQELLGKTGSVTNFWMDHIKTHCYVSYSSIEEAIETRNAVYNLQWPPNGGRLLVAEFVEPQEVQSRVEAPPSPAGPVNAVPALPSLPVPVRPQPSPRVQVQIQVPQPLPTPPVTLPPPPPPPLAHPPAARERALPPPPPLPEKVEPPIVTLDDLFRKTRSTPRIYYLPLSDEEVKAKQNAQAKPASSMQGLLVGRNCLGAGSVMDYFTFSEGYLFVEAEL